MTNRLAELDVFRGLAAIAVVLFHLTTRYDQLYEHPSLVFDFPLGHYGVTWFFMISGFVIFLTLSRTQHASDFIVSRFSRLFPAFWIAVIVTTLAVMLIGLSGTTFTATTVVLNLTMIPELLGAQTVDGVYWTLQYEIMFYFFMMVVWQIKWLDKIEWVCLGWLLLQGVFLFSEYIYGYFPWKLRLFLILDYGHLFVAGILFYRLKYQSQPGMINISRHLLIVISVLLQCIMDDSPESVWVAAGLYASFYLFIYNYLTFIVCKPLVFLGTISYTLYLFHHNLGFVILNQFYQLGVSPLFAIPSVVAICMIIATAVTYFIEKPALRLIRAKYPLRGFVRIQPQTSGNI
ncbi:acyltransferase [Endozoicomonas sp. SM1973]|uniref:Acyltransferase n=1 Tax=Spartinivicinus marinus TaxID=2994442 RepID=A0A853I4F8_9GAMM|nr:acyltransferase [Spartinivicinus marinus]MCX4029781.1 acyltransferase [Spartinivicinus marinus]NYZ67549.1 acyltransferase [Spartinivicinus marinus]